MNARWSIFDTFPGWIWSNDHSRHPEARLEVSPGPLKPTHINQSYIERLNCCIALAT